MKRLLSITWLLLPCLAGVAEQLAILPSDIVLTGPEAQQKLLVERIRDGQFVGQVINQIEFSSSDPAVVRIEKGVAMPVKNGAATIVVKAGK